MPDILSPSVSSQIDGVLYEHDGIFSYFIHIFPKLAPKAVPITVSGHYSNIAVGILIAFCIPVLVLDGGQSLLRTRREHRDDSGVWTVPDLQAGRKLVCLVS